VHDRNSQFLSVIAVRDGKVSIERRFGNMRSVPTRGMPDGCKAPAVYFAQSSGECTIFFRMINAREHFSAATNGA